jgi:hypothetical protein
MICQFSSFIRRTSQGRKWALSLGRWPWFFRLSCGLFCSSLRDIRGSLLLLECVWLCLGAQVVFVAAAWILSYWGLHAKETSFLSLILNWLRRSTKCLVSTPSIKEFCRRLVRWCLEIIFKDIPGSMVTISARRRKLLEAQANALPKLRGRV